MLRNSKVVTFEELNLIAFRIALSRECLAFQDLDGGVLRSHDRNRHIWIGLDIGIGQFEDG